MNDTDTIAAALDYIAAGRRDSEWRADALCAQTAPEVFFPACGDTAAAHLASTICRLCPVTVPCAAEGIRLDRDIPNNRAVGVWGGIGMSRIRRCVTAARR